MSWTTHWSLEFVSRTFPIEHVSTNSNARWIVKTMNSSSASLVREGPVDGRTLLEVFHRLYPHIHMGQEAGKLGKGIRFSWW